MSLEDLLKRVETCSGPDRGLDGRIAWALGWRFNGFIWDSDPVGGPDTVGDFDDWPNVGGHWHRPGGQFADVNEAWTSETEAEHPDPPNVTSSLDTVLALVEEKLPGRGIELLSEAVLANNKRHHRHIQRLPLDTAELARDVIAALLRALISQKEGVE